VSNLKAKYPLRELSIKDFELMCYELLQSTDKYFQLEYLGASMKSHNTDIIGSYEDVDGQVKKIAFEVKHWFKFNRESLIKDLHNRAVTLNGYSRLIYITSVDVSDSDFMAIQKAGQGYSGISIELMDATAIFELLEKNLKVGSKYFTKLKIQLRNRNIKLIGSIISIVVALIYGLWSADYTNNASSLDQHIRSVESTLSNLKTLETDLSKIKKDMDELQATSLAIQQEYERAQLLKSLTKEQLIAVNSAVTYQSWPMTFLNGFIGFIIGIATSVLGNVVYDYFKKRKELQNNE